jgi:hypothetical protein
VNRTYRPILFVLIALLALIAAALACQTSNMRASAPPVWTCPTQAPPPTSTMPPGWDLLTPPAPTYTPYPSPTPYELTSDFPLGQPVHIGDVGGIGFGIWVWVDNVQVNGPFTIKDPTNGAQTTQWVASWDVTVQNASLTADYEFYPFAQLYVLEVIDADGSTHVRGAWGVSGAAHDLIGLPQLQLTQAATLFKPGEQRTVRVAALIPAPEVWRLGYVLDPLNTQDIQAMVANHSIGANVGVWINSTQNVCLGNGSPGSGGTGTPSAYGFLLIRHPVNGTPVITRGFGCSDLFTGELGASCPADQPWFHNGVDYGVSYGAPYVDPLGVPGSVAYAGDNPTGPDCSTMVGSQAPHNGYGNYVKTTATVSGHSLQLWGAHLSAFNTTTGSPTNPGDVLGYAGSTGCSTGTHLHFSVKVDGLYVDPLTLIP